MGGGAPLAFLNKKTWHPGRMQNLEEVWKREQAAAAEQRKLEELRKQYEEERKNAEFTQMAEEAGYKKDSRLDWMYAGSLAAKHAAAAATTGASAPAAGQPQEQPLMGKPPAPDENLSRAERAMQLPSFLAADTPASQNEAWARLNNDPLLAIKKQEQDALKRVKENPIKMQQILKEVEKVRKHKKDKKEMKEKKEKKHKKHHRHSSSSPEDRSRHTAAPPVGQGLKRERSRSRSASPYRPPHAPRFQLHRPSDKYEARPDRDRDRNADRPHQGAPASRDNGSSRGRHRHHHSPSHSRDPRQHISSSAHAGHAHEARRYRSRSRSNSRDRGAGRYERHQRRIEADMQQVRNSHHQHREDRVAATAKRPRSDHAAEDKHDHKTDRTHASHRHEHQTHDEQQGRSSSGRYGLELATDRHTTRGLDMQQLKATTEARAAATRQRLAEAEAAQEAAQAAAAAAQRDRQKKEYKPGKMTAEEKSARLAEMMGNAQQHEEQRLERIQQARAAEAADRGVAGLLAKAAAAQAEDAFKSAAAAEVFGSLAGGGMSLDARISSRRHYHER